MCVFTYTHTHTHHIYLCIRQFFLRDPSLLGCDTVLLGVWFLTFWTITVPPPSAASSKKVFFFCACLIPKDGGVTFLQKAGSHSSNNKTSRHIPEDPNPRQLCCHNPHPTTFYEFTTWKIGGLPSTDIQIKHIVYSYLPESWRLWRVSGLSYIQVNTVHTAECVQMSNP